jgi:hypothetical protein
MKKEIMKGKSFVFTQADKEKLAKVSAIFENAVRSLEDFADAVSRCGILDKVFIISIGDRDTPKISPKKESQLEKRYDIRYHKNKKKKW